MRDRAQMSLLVRSALPADRLAAAVRAELEALDPQQPVYDVARMTERIAQSLERRRFVLVLFELFAGLALLLAAVGLYGVMSYTVAQRTREIGVRVALGARGANVVGLVARDGALMIGLGVALGLAGAAAVTRVLAAVLFEVSPTDPVALAAAALLLAGAAAVAVLAPVRRALAIDPMVVLRDE
jgi:ABC-type antimicrobial peptide transport system permease subunit